MHQIVDVLFRTKKKVGIFGGTQFLIVDSDGIANPVERTRNIMPLNYISEWTGTEVLQQGTSLKISGSERVYDAILEKKKAENKQSEE